MTSSVPSGQPDPSLREAIAAIDRLRRSRATVALVARYAPYAAGGGVVAAIAARWFGWSLTIPVVWLAGSLVALLGAFLWNAVLSSIMLMIDS